MNFKFEHLSASTAISAFSIASIAYSAPIPISHERHVEAICEAQILPSDDRIRDTELFSSFVDGVVDEQSQASLVIGESFTECSVSQTSFFSPEFISIEGEISGISNNSGGLLLCQASPVSRVVYWFEVQERTPFEFTGHLDSIGGGTVVIRLDQAFGGPNIFEDINMGSDIVMIDYSGELEPGVYKLRADVSAYVNPDTEFSAAISIEGSFGAAPCPADLNGDGSLDFFDVSMFLSQFAEGSDFNDDGFTDFFDVSEFLGAFGSGCP